MDLGIGVSAGVLKLRVAVNGLDLHTAGAGRAAYRRRVSRKRHTCVVGRAAEIRGELGGTGYLPRGGASRLSRKEVSGGYRAGWGEKSAEQQGSEARGMRRHRCATVAPWPVVEQCGMLSQSWHQQVRGVCRGLRNVRRANSKCIGMALQEAALDLRIAETCKV